MGNILALCEFSGSQLRSSALSNLTFARQAAIAHGGEVLILLIGAGAAAAGASAAKFASKVITVEDPGLTNYLAETYAPVVARLAIENSASVVTWQGFAATRRRLARCWHGVGHREDGSGQPVFAPDPRW
jgi:electron transfer flavoprotein alpha subunit